MSRTGPCAYCRYCDVLTFDGTNYRCYSCAEKINLEYRILQSEVKKLENSYRQKFWIRLAYWILDKPIPVCHAANVRQLQEIMNNETS